MHKERYRTVRTTVVISAKLRDEYAELIRTGKKHYEIRTEPFGKAQAIRFVSACDGSELGIYRIKTAYPKNRTDERQLIDMAAIGDKAFHNLFPPVEEGGPSTLWVAEIGASTTIEELVRGDQ